MARVCPTRDCPKLVAPGSTHCPDHKPKSWAKTGNAARRRGKSGWEWQRTVKRILKRDGGRCYWCRGKAVTADHVLAVAEGGTDHDANLVAACDDCNDRRRRELVAERAKSRQARAGTPC